MWFYHTFMVKSNIIQSSYICTCGQHHMSAVLLRYFGLDFRWLPNGSMKPIVKNKINCQVNTIVATTVYMVHLTLADI